TLQPKQNEVLIRVMAASVNHYDILSRRGDFPSVPLPRIVGMDCSGYIEQNNGDRTDLTIGQGVIVLGTSLGNGDSGGYATHVCVNQDEVFPIPEGLVLTIATCLAMTYLTAWYALTERLQVEAGQLLLIPGVGGGVASAALQIAKALGVRVIATTSSPTKQDQALKLGAEACFNYKNADFIQEIKDWTGEKGVDWVLDAVGGATIQQGLSCLSCRGTLASIGIVRDRKFCIDAISFLSQEQHLIGVNIGQCSPAKRYEIFLQLAELIKAEKLTIEIDRTFPLAQAAVAHRYVETAGSDRFGKVVLFNNE
ncbi:MAG: zinc-binding dehydrogenase, partial [Cyanobacteria bacterium J06638_38]